MHEMHRSNRFITKEATYRYGKDRELLRPDWIMSYQGMITLASGQIWWTAEVEEVFRKIREGNRRAMIDYLQHQNQQIDDLVVKGTLEPMAFLANRHSIRFDLQSERIYRTTIA